LLDLLRELRLAKKMNYPEPASVDLKMKSYEQQVREELRDALLPLAAACPAAESNPEDCPLHVVRKLNPAQQFQWFDALSEPGLAYLAAYHQVCLTTRLALNVDGNIR
jgi:hypothetical protein